MTTKTKTTGGKAPSHIAYQVKNRDGEAGIFTRIGAAWPHKDGSGYDIQIEAVPLSGRITLRVLSEQQAE